MRNAKQKIRRLRHERNHYRELLSFVTERSHTLESIRGQHVSKIAYLDNVRGNQSQEIIRLNDVISERDMELEDTHRAHALNLCIILMCAIGVMALSIAYVYFKTH